MCPASGAITAIYTVGHGNRESDGFVALLKDAHIECVFDVRAYPESRRHPHFSSAVLERALGASGIDYVWAGARMGGLRTGGPRSPHRALRSASFRAYADHMMSAEYQDALAGLITHGSRARTAIMCAERLPWRCHRSLIADSLAARGVAVAHIIEPGKLQAHRLNPVARIHEGALLYDGVRQDSLDLQDPAG